MAITRNQRFGLITFVILAIAAVLVTLEPWKHSSKKLQTSLPGARVPAITLDWKNLQSGYPSTGLEDTLLSYTGFDLAYNENHEQATWVAYTLTAEEASSNRVGRSDRFRPDLAIRTGSASLADYRNSGFDRGHLAPAADMKWDSAAMAESFLFSNMSPQVPEFNRGIWKNLEEQVRIWAKEKDSLYVITGPVLDSTNTSIGLNRVSVPAYYFKVLVDLSPPDHSIIAFLIPNEKSDRDLFSYALSVDSLENFTGYDFFSSAPDQAAIMWLEEQRDMEKWH